MGGPQNLIAKKFRGPNNLGNKQTSKHKDPVFKILRSRNEKFERKGVQFVLKFIPAISSPSIFGRTPQSVDYSYFIQIVSKFHRRENSADIPNEGCDTRAKFRLATRWWNMSRDLGHKNLKPMHDIAINTSHRDQDQPIFYTYELKRKIKNISFLRRSHPALCALERTMVSLQNCLRSLVLDLQSLG